MDDNNPIHNLAEGGGGQLDEAPPPPPPPPILLTPDAQLLFSILNSHQSSMEELPHYVDETIIEAVNDIAEEFVAKVKKSIVDILFMSKINRPERQERERGLTSKTIVDKGWHKTEKQIETAIRFFPDVVVEQRQGFYPIQWMTMRNTETNDFNLMSISLLPLIIKLAIEFRQFVEEERGGLLSPIIAGRNTLDHIICYRTKKNEDNKLLDHCFSVVRNWMRENNYLVNEDIQRYNLVGRLCAKDNGLLLESRVQYLINIDPVTLSLPCHPERGNWLPMHCSAQQKDIRTFIFLLKVGMQHYPKEFGFIFCDGTHRDDNGKVYRGTPFEFACDKYGPDKVRKLVMDRIQEYICSSSSTSTSAAAANNRETSLLLSAITGETIHRDALYLLVRKDPTAALSKVQQEVLRVEEEDDGPTGSTDTNTHSNDNNSKGGATDTIAAAAAVSASMTTTTAPPTTTTVSSPPPATTAPTSRNSLAIIPLQASIMDPTVSTSSYDDSDTTTIPSDSNDTLPD